MILMAADQAPLPGSVNLIVEGGEGTQHSIVLNRAHKKKPIYVAVGEPGHRSELWRIWANRAKNDVYLAARPLAGIQHWSLHESGDWRLQWTSGDDAEHFTGSRNRIMDRWPRGPAGDGTWTHGISIWVPSAHDVIDVPDDHAVPKAARWLPVPDEGLACGIHVGLARPDQGFFPIEGAVPIDGFVLADGEVLLILVGYVPVTADQEEWLARQSREGRKHGGHFDMTNARAPRLAIRGFDERGNRVVWDLAADAR